QLGGTGGGPARPGRGVPAGVRVPAAGAAAAGAAGQARHHVRQPAGDPGAAVRGVPVPGVGHPARRGRSAAQRHPALDHPGRRPVRGGRRRGRGEGVPLLVKILHTSDWHVGKVLKGQSRLEEQQAVLTELVGIARDESPDLVLVAGDLFDTAAPIPAATRLVTGALSALRDTGAEVVAIAGNHDNGPALDALRPWAEAAGITLRGSVRAAADHLLSGTTAAGEPWRLVALPFLSQRYAVRATELFDLSAAEATQTYADLLARLLAVLTEGFTPDAVNLVTTHLTVVGATAGGGERE